MPDLGVLPPNPRDFGSHDSDTSTGANEGDFFEAKSPKALNLLLCFRSGGRMEFATGVKLPSIRGFCALRAKNQSKQLHCRLEFTSNVRPTAPEKTFPKNHTANNRRRILRSGYAWLVASQQSQPPFHRTSHNLRRFGFLIKHLLISGGSAIPFFQSRAIHAK